MIRGAQGDRAAFELLCARHLPRLYVVALRLGADPAAAEESRRTRWCAPGGTPLASIRRGEADKLAEPDRREPRDRLPARGAARGRALRRSAWNGAGRAAEHRAPRPGRGAGIRAGRPPARQRTALLLTYAEDRAGQDAARSLGISVRALEGLLRRGRRFLRHGCSPERCEAPMTRWHFSRRLARRGADLARWPDSERGAALRLLHRSAAARRRYLAALDDDAGIGAEAADLDPAVTARLMAGTRRGVAAAAHRSRRARPVPLAVPAMRWGAPRPARCSACGSAGRRAPPPRLRRCSPPCNSPR